MIIPAASPPPAAASRCSKTRRLQLTVDEQDHHEGRSVAAALEEEEQQQQQQLDRFHDIATKLRTSSIHGNGFDSRDPRYGVENVQADIPVNSNNEGLGLELLEIAHSTTHSNRGLVLVSGVSGNAANYSSIQVGDTIVGVACNKAKFKVSTAGMDYDSTVDAIIQAKTRAEEELVAGDRGSGSSNISFQLNRLVRRAPVQVVVEKDLENNEPTTVLECLAGDNLRLVLKRHNIYHCSNDCGGEGICGSDMVEIIDGEESVKYLMKASANSTSKTRRRKACQTIVGANNEPSTIRVRLCD